jgi:transcriptional regulator with XRE-family HTH domain
MSLGKRLKMERVKRNWSQKYVAEKIGITNTVLSNYERDYRDPDTETLKKLADLYEVSVDYLLGRNHWSKLPELTPRDEREIAKDLEKMIQSLENPNDGYSAFDGQIFDDVDEEDRELLINALEQSMRLAKRIAKKKYTPKKYRKEK